MQALKKIQGTINSCNINQNGAAENTELVQRECDAPKTFIEKKLNYLNLNLLNTYLLNARHSRLRQTDSLLLFATEARLCVMQLMHLSY